MAKIDGISLGALILIGGGIYLATRGAQATPAPGVTPPGGDGDGGGGDGLPLPDDEPPPPTPDPLPDPEPWNYWYDLLNIGGTIGWTLEEYLAAATLFYQAFVVDHTLWVDEFSWQEDYAFYDMRSPSCSEFRVAVNAKIKQLGGYYTHEITASGTLSVFKLPSTWTGTKAAFFDLVMQQLTDQGLVNTCGVQRLA